MRNENFTCRKMSQNEKRKKIKSKIKKKGSQMPGKLCSLFMQCQGRESEQNPRNKFAQKSLKKGFVLLCRVKDNINFSKL